MKQPWGYSRLIAELENAKEKLSLAGSACSLANDEDMFKKVFAIGRQIDDLQFEAMRRSLVALDAIAK